MSGEKKGRTTKTTQSQLKLTQRIGTTATMASSPTVDDNHPNPANASNNAADNEALKESILASVRNEIADIFRTELQATVGKDLETIKNEIQALKTELSGKITSTQADVRELSAKVGQMEPSLTMCSDDITVLQTQVKKLSKEVQQLENRCEEQESRSRRGNIRITGIFESVTVSTSSVSKLLKDAFELDREPLLDRAHRGFQRKPEPGDKREPGPRVVVAKCHYFSDCMDILKKARERGKPVVVGRMKISVFPDHTAKISKDRAAFNDVKKDLRDIEGLRFGIMHPARMRITYKGEETFYDTPGEVEEFVRKLNLPSLSKTQTPALSNDE